MSTGAGSGTFGGFFRKPVVDMGPMFALALACVATGDATGAAEEAVWAPKAKGIGEAAAAAVE